MSKAKLGAMWSTTASIIRANSLAIVGHEPLLKAFIPSQFLPAEPVISEEQRIEAEEFAAKKAVFDLKITQELMQQGKLRRR